MTRLPMTRLPDDCDTFMQIVKEALAKDIVNSFMVAAWWSCGTPADDIVTEIAARTQAHRAS